MTFAPIEVQPGWKVFTSDGQEVGTVVALSPDMMRVKMRGFMAGQQDIPKSLIAETETGRVELNVAKADMPH
jgi:hypothetical protein